MTGKDHDYPGDYWRFTPKSFELLLRRFSLVEVEYDGAPQFPEGIYGFGTKEECKGFLKNAFLNPVKSLKRAFSG